MNLLKRLQAVSDDDLLVLGGEETEAASRRPMIEYVFFISLILSLLSAIVVWWLSGAVLDQYQLQLRQLAELEVEEEAYQANLDALESLIAQEDSIRSQQELVEEALPFDPLYHEVVAFVEDQVDAIADDHQLKSPEHISWRRVSGSDISNEEVQELGVYQYALQLEGSYEGLLAFVESLRLSRRLLDLRSLDHFQMDPSGQVRADLSFWAYHIL